MLHRNMTEEISDPGDSKDEQSRGSRAAAKGRNKLKEVQRLFASIRQEIPRDQFWRYQRNVSPGLQEYIEALSFTHYLETGQLVSYNQVQQSLSDENGVVRPALVEECVAPTNLQFFPLPLEDYLLGLSDLTGELMRYAISAISQRGGRTKAKDVCVFVRACRAGRDGFHAAAPRKLNETCDPDFETFTPYYRELRKKQSVTSQSLQKIEDGGFVPHANSCDVAEG